MFRFSIRDVLWLTVVVAMGVGWWVHLRREKEILRAQMRAVDAEMERVLARQKESLKRVEEIREQLISKGFLPIGPDTEPQSASQ